MEKDLTKGNVLQTMVMFAIPMVIGDLLQQCYNIADTLIVGRVLGKEVLAAVGSSYTLMTFLTSILIGLSLGSGGSLFDAVWTETDRCSKRSYVYFFCIYWEFDSCHNGLMLSLSRWNLISFASAARSDWYDENISACHLRWYGRRISI